MERDSKGIPTVILTSGTLGWERLMAKEFILGRMEKCMTESGTRDSSMAMGSGKDSTMTHTLESGVIPRRTDMEFTLGRMGIGMKVNGICV